VRLLQFLEAGAERVARVDANGAVLPLSRYQTTWQLARQAIAERKSLEQLAGAEPVDAPLSYAELLGEERLLPPLTHPPERGSRTWGARPRAIPCTPR
jgi:hypothetical protein